MKNVRWIPGRRGTARLLTPKDLDRLEIKHNDKDLVWNQANNFTLEMSNQMSDSLVEKLPTEFSATGGDDESPPANSLDDSSSGSSEGSPDESVPSGDDDAQASTPKRRRKS